MCALPECNCTKAVELILENSLDATMIASSNNISESKTCVCDVNKPLLKQPNELGPCTSLPFDACILDNAVNFNHQKSLYMAKGCKYSFIASDYISPEGLKLLSIKVYEKPFETDASTSKNKDYLSKRSISEYFLTKSVLDRESRDDKGKANSLLKTWHKTFSKPHISHPVDHYDTTNYSLMHPTSLIQAPKIDKPHASKKLSPAQEPHQQQQLCSYDSEACGSKDSDDTKERSHSICLEKSGNKIGANPNVNYKVFDIESLCETGQACDTDLQENVQYGLDDSWFIPSARHAFNGADISASASTAQLSVASSFGDSSLPICKVCHTAAKAEDPLISPCRCTGTLRYIHCGCLMKWLNICNKRSRKPPTCELCKYQFHWHKKFMVRHCQFPQCSWQDKILHTVFLISVLIMITCGIVTVLCFKQQKSAKTEIPHLELTQSEIVTLICGALFFLAFFLAMYVEIKARNTLYKLMRKFIHLNQRWYIDEYDKKENSAIDV